jgi:hypothetical protein
MSISDIQELVQLTATVIGISGVLLGLYKYFSNKREKELREWQKVVIYKIFRQNELKTIGFTDILEKYRIEAQASMDIDLKKNEISEDALRRILLELVSSNIIRMEPSDSFRIKLSVEKPDLLDIFHKINKELVQMVGQNPFTYSIEEVVKEIAPKLGIDIPLLRNDLRQAISQGKFVVDKAGRIAFPK